ncbi:MAG: sulfurtransferase TusA family protein [Deltaproteobacteria bacterium]
MDELDTLGLLCPLPVLKARKRLLRLPVGAMLRVLSDDPVAVIDLPMFCREAGHELISHDGTIFVIRRGVGRVAD